METQQPLEAAEAEIRRVVESWVIYRDAGLFDRLLTLWHDDGVMMTTWSQVSAVEFIRLSTAAFARGMRSTHFSGGCAIDIRGSRAIAQSKMSITQRASIDGIVCDALCIGRFYDFFEQRAGEWKIVLRQPVYERDRLDPVDPTVRLELDPELLAEFPDGYRHLGYLQTKAGMTVKKDLPGLTGPAIEDLYARGWAWLDGQSRAP
jgi:hypothetical protein